MILQICADALGLPIENFDLVIGDTDRTADAGKSSASRQTFVSGKAAYLAGRDLRMKILAAAEAGPDATLRLADASDLALVQPSVPENGAPVASRQRPHREGGVPLPVERRRPQPAPVR